MANMFDCPSCNNPITSEQETIDLKGWGDTYCASCGEIFSYSDVCTFITAK
jgi:transcription elongation factor Elf1